MPFEEGGQTEGAAGDIVLTWGARDDLLLALDVRKEGESTVYGESDGPLLMVAGDTIVVEPRLTYGIEGAVPSGTQGLVFLVQDMGGFVEPFIVVSGPSIPPQSRLLRKATLPPETPVPDTVRFVAWELGEGLSVSEVACPAPVGATHTCSAELEVASGPAAGFSIAPGTSTLAAGDILPLAVTPVDWLAVARSWVVR